MMFKKNTNRKQKAKKNNKKNNKNTSWIKGIKINTIKKRNIAIKKNKKN